MNLEKSKDELSSKDAILENPKNLIPCIRTFENEGLFEEPKVILKQSYTGTLEVLFELWNWLSLLYDDPDNITSVVQESVKRTINQNYDRQKLLPLANNPDTVSETLKWVYELIESPVWRQAIYELAEQPQNDGCPFLSMTMTCMAFNDKYLGELAKVPKSWSEMSTLMRCARYLLEPLLSMATDSLKIDRATYLHMKDQMEPNKIDPNSPEFHNNSRAVLYFYLNGFLDMGCHSEHTYLIIQSLLQCLDRNTRYHLPQHLSRLLEEEAISRRCHEAAKYSVYFRNTRDYPEAMKAMNIILIRQQLVNEDLQKLYELYKSDVPPPVDLLRITLFIDLISDRLFLSKEALLQEQVECLSYLLSYAASVEESYSSNDDSGCSRTYCNRSHVQEVKQKIEAGSKICRQWTNTSAGGLSIRSYRDLPTLLELIVSPPIAYACFRFLEQAFEQKRSDFELNIEALKPYTILVNELASCHPGVHPKLLRFLISLLNSTSNEMEALREMEYKKCVVDCLLHLLIQGHAEEVIGAVSQLLFSATADTSLVRHFLTELLDLCQPPYSMDFMNWLEPLASHADIQGGLQAGREADSVNEFIDHCRNHMISSSTSR